MKWTAALFVATLALGACARHQPIVYQTGGAPGGVEAAIAECRGLAERAGAQQTGGAGTTVRDAAAGGALGAATGATATLLRNLLNEPAPNPAYRAYVERCLRERGYDVVGWQ